MTPSHNDWPDASAAIARQLDKTAAEETSMTDIAGRPLLADIPVVASEELNTLPAGLYQTTRREQKLAHDIVTNESYVGECALLARISEPGLQFPSGVERITVRPDGCWIVYQWVRADSGKP